MGQKCFPEYLFSNLVSSSEYFIEKQARQSCVWICLQIYAQEKSQDINLL